MNFKLSKEQEFVRKMVREFPDVDFSVLHHGDKCGCIECIRKRMKRKPYVIHTPRGDVMIRPTRTNLCSNRSARHRNRR